MLTKTKTMNRPRVTTLYNVISDVRKEIPGDPNNELLCLQYVFPTHDGIAYPEDAAYRFIRFSTKENRLKSQMGQAQIQDLKIMLDLIVEMADKRNISLK